MNLLHVIFASFLLLILASCSSKKEPPEEVCEPLLRAILNIQNHRDVSSEDFRLTLESYGMGQTTRARMKKEYKQWLSKENELASKVSDLYSEAYHVGCL